MSDKNGGKWAMGALIGGIAGYVAGILTAPKSGEKTRRDIKQNVEKGKAELEKELKNIQGELEDALKKSKDAAVDMTDQAKKKFNDTVGTATTAKDKAGEVLKAVRDDDDTTDADLEKAVAEASQALKDLKRYLKK